MKARFSPKKILKFQIPISIVLLLSWSCNSQQKEVGRKNLSHSTDTITRDIPKFFQSEKWNRYFSDLQSSLNLPSLQNGVKEWQVRIWIAHGVYDYKDSTQLIILKKEGEVIRSTLYTYVTQSEPSSGLSSINTVGSFTSLHPKSEWDSFVDNLEKLSVFTLPDYTKIKGYHLATDSYGVIIEVAKGNTYRIYEYPDYEQHVDTLSEAQKILQILKLVESEFGIKVRY
ncbi:MAG TPA: hypothetical protein PKE30_01235 [Niabella sp.]|nr:hypothetical protein [Niabella sp.]